MLPPRLNVPLLGLALLVVPSAPAAQAAARVGSADEVAKLAAETDALYAVRDEPGKLEELKAKLDGAEKLAPASYEVLWRLARYYFWAADDLKIPAEEKSRLGKIGWEYGDRATQADPSKVEGWFFAAAGVGNYSLGMGVVKALLQGLEGKFTERLEKAAQIDPSYNGGGPEVSWGRYYYELPWPKYDPEKSEFRLHKGLRVNPRNVRARVYLAELYLKENHPKEARTQLEKALKNPPGAYDAPEERRYQERARDLLAKMPSP
jgi:tetratricopeptide (TPR) repeat protein